MIKTGVIGHPIAHSKSPLIHNYWIGKYGLDGHYNAIDIPPENLTPGVKDLIDQGYKGFNLTVPHKELIVPLCDDIDDTARIIGAVNTVLIDRGRIIATNTDAYGFIQNIRDEAPDFDFKDKRALIIGAGGAARAVLYGLREAGIGEITLTNRTREKTEILAGLYSDIRVLDWDKRSSALGNVDLLINTTALGMTGKPDLEFDLTGLKQSVLVHDIVYAPLHTKLLQDAAGRGLRTVTGIGMLLQQARPAFNLWYGTMPDIDEALKSKVLA